MATAKTSKPQKPTKDFPLFPHDSGQWAKKIGGKLRYFGAWGDPDAALGRFLGRTTPATPTPATSEGASKIASADKPEKPTKDFPLFPHDCGQWAKKMKGKLHYFGAWANDRKGQAAIKRYAEDRDDLLAGRTPMKQDGLTLVELVNAFLTAKESRVNTGELSPRTYEDYDRVCQKVIEVLGARRHVSALRAADFEALRASFAKTHAAVRLGKDITYVRSLFKHGYDSDLIDRPIKFGPGFRRPSRVALRKLRHKLRQQNGPRMFDAAEIRAMLEKAGPQLKAMILLGCNAGLGNNDLALLTMKAIDMKAGWLDYPRPKTATDRRCPLWPETVAAIKAAIEARPTPKDVAHADRVFITKYGHTWEAKSVCDSPVAKETAKLVKELGIHRHGVGFYALRHTFQTIAEKARDKDAVRAIMGHTESANDMSVYYSEEAVDASRLRAVTDYVRSWLFPKTEDARQTERKTA